MRTMARASRTAPLSIVMESWLSASAMLRNASVLVARGGARVRIAGLEDLEEAKLADLDAATADFDGREHARVEP